MTYDYHSSKYAFQHSNSNSISIIQFGSRDSEFTEIRDTHNIVYSEYEIRDTHNIVYSEYEIRDTHNIVYIHLRTI
jgi:hypothetical protein